jgi:hypothetical protein
LSQLLSESRKVSKNADIIYTVYVICNLGDRFK